jgi:glyoxylase-like metal-dependent hydrolase (beta-lactamase superfamily II)/ferredoxin
MASLARRLDSNVPGDFFVDSSCIDCETCRWVAPGSFAAGDGASRVWHQPTDRRARLRAEMALLACPVGAIGTVEKHDLALAHAAFPDPIEDNVCHCGFHSEASFGAASYLILRPEGNVLVDSPRFTAPLVNRIEALGGVRLMVLTHCDDVADHQRFRDRFGCERVMHERDIRHGTRDVEIKIDAAEPIELFEGGTLIPVPGHTAGSMCLHYADKYLFSGDHMDWNPETGHVAASRDYCWYDWGRLVRSTRRLLDYRFEWLLPGHGHPVRLPAPRMRSEIDRFLQQESHT